MIKQVIVVRKDLNMRKGKMCAQVGHAVMYYMLDKEKDIELYKQWISTGSTKIVVGCEDIRELMELKKKAQRYKIPNYEVVDFGLTEFHNQPTTTCVAFGPDETSRLDDITGHLKLL